ncbi:MAG: T9SS type A sorting domain-containing protein, partial [Bacteroidota bacterium]
MLNLLNEVYISDATNNDTINLFDANPLTAFWNTTTTSASASGQYNTSTGNITLSLENISYWHIEGPAGVLTGTSPNLTGLSAELTLDNEDHTGAFTKTSWSVTDHNLGDIAQTGLIASDLYLVVNYKGSGLREGIRTPLDGSVITNDSKELVDRGITIGPNPTNGLVKISSASNAPCSIRVHNTFGQLFIDRKGSLNTSLNLSGLPKGIYIISLSNDNISYAKKVILR